MVDQDALLAQLVALFREELVSHVEGLNANLLELEKALGTDQATEHVRALLRSTHALKGAARAAGVRLVEESCHRMEELLVAVRDQQLVLLPTHVQLLFDTVDGIAEAGELLRREAPVESGRLAAVLPRFGGALMAAAPMLPELTPGPPSDPGTFPPSRPPTARLRLSIEKIDALAEQSRELLAVSRAVVKRRDELTELFTLLQEAETSGGARLEPLRAALSRFDQKLASDFQLLSRSAEAIDGAIHRLRALSFGEAVEGLSRIARDIAKASGKQVQLVLSGEQVELDRAVADRLRDPLIQLIRNAVDHGIERPERRVAAGKPPKGLISVGATVQGEHLELTVADDGAGLNLDAIRQHGITRGFTAPADSRALAHWIFLPGFSTAHTVTNTSGRGVGLDLVRAGVDDLRGTVDFTTEPGRGTRFVLTVPLAPAAAKSRRKLLLADDSVATLYLQRRLLEDAGYEVLTAADGVEAWQLLQTTPVDVVVSDVEMPRMDGIELTETIRRSSQRAVPIVLVSGRASERDRARGLTAGANAYVPKSEFEQQSFLELLKQLV